MSGDIGEAKARLPLPGLMHQLGLGEHAKKRALCPFHDDHRESFSVFKTDKGAWLWKCFTCNSSGDEIEFLRQYENLSNRAAIRRFVELAGVNGSKLGTVFKKAKAVMSKDWQPEPKPVRLAKPVSVSQAFDWQKCNAQFTAEHQERLCDWRLFSPDFVSWLRTEKLIGIYDGCIAFPVHSGGHYVVGAHVRAENGDWFYHPKGTKAAPLIFGEIAEADTIHSFESTFDTLAFMDRSGERVR
jgi:CHC2-type zinc finger protein